VFDLCIAGNRHIPFWISLRPALGNDHASLQRLGLLHRSISQQDLRSLREPVELRWGLADSFTRLFAKNVPIKVAALLKPTKAGLHELIAFIFYPNHA